jgi:hypothetical protein
MKLKLELYQIILILGFIFFQSCERGKINEFYSSTFEISVDSLVISLDSKASQVYSNATYLNTNVKEQFLALNRQNGAIYVFDLKTRKVENTIVLPDSGPHAVSNIQGFIFRPKSNTIIVISNLRIQEFDFNGNIISQHYFESNKVDAISGVDWSAYYIDFEAPKMKGGNNYFDVTNESIFLGVSSLLKQESDSKKSSNLNPFLVNIDWNNKNGRLMEVSLPSNLLKYNKLVTLDAYDVELALTPYILSIPNSDTLLITFNKTGDIYILDKRTSTLNLEVSEFEFASSEAKSFDEFMPNESNLTRRLGEYNNLTAFYGPMIFDQKNQVYYRVYSPAASESHDSKSHFLVIYDLDLKKLDEFILPNRFGIVDFVGKDGLYIRKRVQLNEEQLEYYMLSFSKK